MIIRDENIDTFMNKPCSCKRKYNTRFIIEAVTRQIDNVRKMTKDEKDLHGMALLSDGEWGGQTRVRAKG